MAQYKGIKEILKKFWNASKIWIKNNFTTKKFRKLKFHSMVAENGHTVINMGNDAVNIYIHKDGCYAKFDKMPTEGSIQKITDVFKVELFPDTCVIDTFDVSVDVSWNTISDVDGDDDNVIEILRNHINSIGNPHDTSVDNVIGLSAVGRTGDYKDILNKPTIPTENTVEEWGFTKFSGSYNDLSNKPTIPEAQVQTDWEATEGIGAILNKPTLGTAAAKNYTSSISNNSTDLPTSESVYSYINSLGIENIIAQIGNIDTNIDNIEQQLSNIFTAENKVTDFNTTTNSGIYFWIDGSANKPGTDYGVLLVNKFDNGSGIIWINQIAYDTNGHIYFRQEINNNNWTEWKAVAYYDETVAAQGYLCKLYQLSSATSNSTTQAYNVILLGKIPDPSSTAAPATPATSWDIDVDFYFVRPQGHKASWCNVKAGYGYSNGWRKYGLIETFGVDSNSNYTNPFYLVTVKYNNEYYIGVRHKCDIDGVYSARVGNVNINDNRNPSTVYDTPLVNMLKVVPYQKTSSGSILNNEIKTSIADFPNTYAPTVERNGSLVLRNYADVELDTYGKEPLTIGNIDSINIGIDTNEIQARDNGKASQLNLNNNGGAVKMGANTNFIICNENKLTIQGDTVSSNSFTDTNPKLVFNNINASQNISLTFTDYDAVQAPASLTLNGNQGNEYFIAPCIKANNVMKIPTSAPATKENGCIWIG